MKWVMFFDGDCAFCSKSVREVYRRDRRGRIDFAPLQGAFAARLGFAHHADPVDGTMVILRESDGAVFLHSDGWLELARALGGWWRWLALAHFVPRFLRDAVYRWVARNRYRFMGKSDHCELPDPGMMARVRL
jgi:predicted DCC family thiol-disulfide oxidoreductase YuxK